MSSITIWVLNLILVGPQFTHEILFHYVKTLSLCCQGITSEFTNSEYLTINLYMCVLCEILPLRVSLDQFSSLSLFSHLLLQCYCSPLSSIPASYNQYWVPFLKIKEDTIQSVRLEVRWTLEYKLNYTIKYLYYIYLNINICKSILPHQSKKREQVFFNWAIVATMWQQINITIEKNTLVT